MPRKVRLWLADLLPSGLVQRALVVTALLLPVYTIAAYALAITSYPDPVDYAFFGPSGADILTGQWSRVYENGVVQAGPLELLVFGVAYAIGLQGFVGWLVYYTVFMALLTFGVVFAFLLAIGDGGRTRLFYAGLGIGAAACLGWFIPLSLLAGHPSQIVIPVSWVVAGFLAKRAQFVAVGVVIGLAVGWELWGILGIPVVLLAAKPNLVKAATGGLVTLLVLFLPFVLTGVFNMFEFSWPIGKNTLVHLLWPSLTEFPWVLRLAQSVLVLAIGSATAILSRRSMHGLWLVPLTIVAARLVTDPTLYGYYWIAALILMIGFTAALIVRSQWVMAGAALIVTVGLWAYTTKGLVAAAVLLLVLLACTAWIAVAQRRSGSLILREAL